MCTFSANLAFDTATNGETDIYKNIYLCPFVAVSKAKFDENVHIVFFYPVEQDTGGEFLH